uniref:non-specific serine/threonine protein kinase n=1 Tax=Babesia bovis TaxID=5865 RepID=A7ASH0_BABBO|eukprot:XP_001611057.1 PK4 protein kinase [Babesia bovis T2Bo]
MNNVSLARTSNRSLWPWNEDTGGHIGLVILDTEGLAYNTNFSRNVLWVTRLTDNLLNVRKPNVQTTQTACALNSIPIDSSADTAERNCQANGTDTTSYARESTRRHSMRHLVPSYDGFVYCVNESGHHQLLHIHVRDIVNFTPFRTPLLDGVYLEGSRYSSVMALDFETGSYIARHPNGVSVTNDVGPIRDPGPDGCNLQQLHIAYTDWTVRAFDDKTHDELWSFNWREIGAVNSESTSPPIIERIRDVIQVEGKILSIQYEEDGDSYREYMNFPFDIAAVFAVINRPNDDILTLQLVERIAIPPPAAFLQNSSNKGFEPIRLTSSSYFGTSMLSVSNGVIDVPNMWDVGARLGPDTGSGRLIEIKVVDPLHYTSDTRLEPLTISQAARLRWRHMKWHYVMRCWIVLFIFAVIVTCLRLLRHCINTKSRFIISWHRIPFADIISNYASMIIGDIERRAFEATERVIYNVDHLSPMYSVDTVCRTFNVPLGILNFNERSTPAAQLLNLISPSSRRSLAAQSTEQSLGQEVNNTTELSATVAESSIQDAANNEDDVTRDDELQHISVVPSGTPLAGFLENGRFLRTFDCIKLLGKGGFGSVYRAQHKLEPGNPTYAVKLVLLRLKASEGLTSKRYFREIAANREISSKYVVRYFTWWCEEPHFLPLTQLTAELQSAAATNVKHLVDNNSIDTHRTKTLHGFMDHYQDMLKELVARSSDESVNSVLSANRYNIPRGPIRRSLTVIGEQTDQSHCPSVDSMLNGACAIPFEEENNQSGCPADTPSSQGIVFAYSQTPQMLQNNLGLRDISRKNNIEHASRHKDDEKSYPVVLLILMELCRGFTLREWLNRPERDDKPLGTVMSSDGIPIEFDLFRQLIKGLRDIHANNFIHRDLKPENIFVDPITNALKIGDFGLVGFISQSTRDTCDSPQDITLGHDPLELYQDGIIHPRELLRPGSSIPEHIIGTPGYTAPEGGFNCSEKADIYSASLILLELLSPRFKTSMERFAVLENYRNAGTTVSHRDTKKTKEHGIYVVR